MIPISVQTGGVSGIYDTDGTSRVIREAGFDAVDVNLDELLPYSLIVKQQRVPAFDAEGDDLLSFFRPWKDTAEKYSLMNAQAHAPFPSYVEGAEEYNEYLMRALEKTIAGCGYIGCPRLVIHPFFNGYDKMMTPEAEWEKNIESYTRLIPAAKRHGVIICLENMFTSRRGKRYAACCSDFTMACKYVDELNALAGERRFGFCLDTGHALLTAQDIQQVMLHLGDRIECFHVHDNNGIEDQHIAPYMGILDWNRFIEGLRLLHFDKPLSFETFNAIQCFDPALAPDLLRLIARTGRMFIQRAGL